MRSFDDRPAEASDRRIPGHWVIGDVTSIWYDRLGSYWAS
jgi:hypothetical protein